MKRDDQFYINFYVIPSILFILISYCSYWIDKSAAPARVAVGITTVLITISFYNGISEILPPVDTSVWLEQYYTGILAFTCATMIEYAIVNFCTFHFNMHKNRIDTIVNEIKQNLGALK